MMFPGVVCEGGGDASGAYDMTVFRRAVPHCIALDHHVLDHHALDHHVLKIVARLLVTMCVFQDLKVGRLVLRAWTGFSELEVVWRLQMVDLTVPGIVGSRTLRSALQYPGSDIVFVRGSIV